MKILLSADWHIKLGQKNVPRDWQWTRYVLMFEKLYELEKEVNIHIIAGDVFDTHPKTDEIALFLKFISGCSIKTIIFDGNHEATRKGRTFLTHLSDAVNSLNSKCEILDGPTSKDFYHNAHGDVDTTIDFIPYTHLKTFDPKEFNSNICCTHVRGNIPPHVVEEVNLDKFAQWEVVLAGDLHSYENSQRNILYPGSPVSTSFHRNRIKNGVIIFDTDTMEHEFIDLELPQLIRKTVDKEEDIVKTEYDHTIYEITGNVLELSGVDTSLDIIDKKIINKTNDALLNLENLTIEDELTLYLKEVLNLSQDDIDGVLKKFNDYYTGLELE